MGDEHSSLRKAGAVRRAAAPAAKSGGPARLTQRTGLQGLQALLARVLQTRLEPASLVHIVKRGENLTTIAALYDGVTLDAIVAANHITDPNKIAQGQHLRIPDKGALAAPPATARSGAAKRPTRQPVEQKPAQASAIGTKATAKPDSPAPIGAVQVDQPHNHENRPILATGSERKKINGRSPSARRAAQMNQQWDRAKHRLVDASHRAGIEPGIMVKIAAFESGFKSSARPISGKKPWLNRVRQFDGVMAVSSAYGYGQFTDASWTDTLNRYGAKYGVEKAGKLNKASAAAYRTNEDLQAAMLAEFTKANITTGRALGGNSDDANVYALHNLGSGDGPRFLRALAKNPAAEVQDVLGEAVIRGNPSLYADGSITLQDAYRRMAAAMANGNRFAEEARALSRPKPGQ